MDRSRSPVARRKALLGGIADPYVVVRIGAIALVSMFSVVPTGPRR
jgi:hypothetical protein